MMLKFFFTLLAQFILLINSIIVAQQNLIDKIAIKVAGDSREFFFTNKLSLFYYGETNSPNKNSWQGITYNNQRFLLDHSLLINNKPLLREKAQAIVYPHKIIRVYPNNVKEILFVPDSVNALMLEIKPPSKKNIKINFKLNNANIINQDEFETVFNSNGNKVRIEFSSKIYKCVFKDQTLKLEFENTEILRIAFSINESPKLITLFDGLLESKKRRIENLFYQTGISCDNKKLEKAIYWNIASLDALITNQGMRGIYAGLPWFNDYWGRDNFISLPGATFLIGNFNDAKEILRAFSQMQDKSPQSKFYGRIPNRITLTETIYNTVDGTPWFVIQAFRFIKSSGDLDFAKEIYPSIKLASDAALLKHCDEKLFLVHEDAETWMDAVGPNGPWTPRGNRANDVQALWYGQLKATCELALLVGDTASYIHYKNLIFKLKENILKHFVDTTNYFIYDHLNSDNTIDKQIRPNLFFVLNEQNLLDDEDLRIKILSNVFDKLVYPYGVLSLSYLDDNFHPFHQYEPYYVKDAAYHNGTIWLWNFGPVITSLIKGYRTDLAYQLTNELINHTLERGCVGGLSELMDAFPKNNFSGSKLKIKNLKSQPELSGTFVQAWSMSEFIRNFYEDYLGINVDKINSTIDLTPSISEGVGNVNFNIFYGDEILPVTYINEQNKFSINIDASKLKSKLKTNITFRNNDRTRLYISFEVNSKDRIEIKFLLNADSVVLYRNGEKEIISLEKELISRLVHQAQQIKFGKPKFNPYWKSIKEPEYKILTIHDIKKNLGKSKIFISSVCESKIKYNHTLPLNSSFKEGMTNLKYFEINENTKDYFFKLKFEDLVNPNWHPEYGFQLTYIAIAIQSSGIKFYGRNIGRNSNLILPDSLRFNRIIFIGGGIEICDHELKVLAKYSPAKQDITNPLGDAEQNIISFSIRKDMLGKLNSPGKITIIIGLQDDHGGAGIGVFRNIEENASEWKGGNKKSSDDPNIYEIVFVDY